MPLSRLSLAILSVLAGAPAFADDSGVDLDQGWNQTQKTAWLEAGQARGCCRWPGWWRWSSAPAKNR